MSDEKTEKKPMWAGNTTKWVVASLVGIGSGCAKFVTDVRKEFYMNARQFPEVKEDLLPNHGVQLGIIKDARKAGITNTETFISHYSNEKSRFFDEVNKFSEKLGIESRGLKGLTKGSLQRYRTLSETTKVPVVFGAVATTVIGFAGTSMFLNSLANRHAMKQIAKIQAQDREQSH